MQPRTVVTEEPLKYILLIGAQINEAEGPGPQDNYMPSYVASVLDGGGQPCSMAYDAGYILTGHSYATGTTYRFRDCYVGRIPAYYERECKEALAKLVYYEKTPNTTSTDWYQRMFALTEFDWDAPNNPDHDKANFVPAACTAYKTMCCPGFNSQPYNEDETWGSSGFDTSNSPRLFIHLNGASYPPSGKHLNRVEQAWCDHAWAEQKDYYSFFDAVPTELYPSCKTVDRGDVVNAINDGVGLFLYFDHGGESEWQASHFSSTRNIPPAPPGQPVLQPNNKTPFVLSTACLTGAMLSDRLGSKFLSAYEDGNEAKVGAMGFVGASIITDGSSMFSLPPYFLMSLFGYEIDPPQWNAMLGSDWPRKALTMRPAVALVYAKARPGRINVQGDSSGLGRNLLEFNYLGDPELELRTKAPRYLNVSCPTAIHLSSEDHISVTVAWNNSGQAGDPVGGARVALSEGDKGEGEREGEGEGECEGMHTLAVGITDETGQVSISVACLTPGDYQIVVTEQNAVPYITASDAIEVSEN